MPASRSRQQLAANDPKSEFGILGLNLIHQLAGPLTATLINIEQLSQEAHRLQASFTSAQLYLTSTNPKRRFNVSRQINKALAQLPTTKRLAVRLSVRDDLVLIGESTKFGIIVANFVSNALESYGRRSNDKPVYFKAQSTTTGVKLIITDRGRGMTVRQQALISQPFYSRKSDHYRHLGLGLYIACHCIVQDFSGRIAVTSQLGQGTTFVIYLANQ